MQTLLLQFPHAQCPVYIGKNLLSQGLLSSYLNKRVMIVTQKKIADLYLQDVLTALAKYEVDVCLIPDGEENKTLSQWQYILETLIAKQHDRKSTLVALGGGVVGDIAGFAAGCFMRGIPFIQIPTTLIAQVDAAIGGKTAVNVPAGKNLIGLFYQPQCVIADVMFLQSLSDREYFSGLAEVIKCGLIHDADFFTWLENHAGQLVTRDQDCLLQAIYKAASIKADFVMRDEKEMGLRRLLNFGHTFGHALEAATQYQTYLHGEAVALGMVMASRLSQEQVNLPERDVARIQALLSEFKLLQQDVSVSPEKLLIHMGHDKKKQGDQFNLILLERLGKAVEVMMPRDHLAKLHRHWLL